MSGAARPTRMQLRALNRIANFEPDEAHDLEGDLSVLGGNWPATHHGLVRRGWVEATWHPEYASCLEGWWSYRLTDAGQEVLTPISSLRGGGA